MAIACLLALNGCVHLEPGQKPVSNLDDTIYQLSFTPEEGQEALVHLIREARESVFISLYGFDNESIDSELIKLWFDRGTSKSLAWAKAHGKVKVDLVTEFDSEAEGSWSRLIKAGIPVHLRNDSGIMHNKYFIIDETYVVTGSTNLTQGMFKHFNNMIILKSPGLANDFLRDFVVIRQGTSSSQKDTEFAALFNAGLGSDGILGTADDNPGVYFGSRVQCDPSLDGLDEQICSEIISGEKSWSQASLTESQWNLTSHTGFSRELYSAGDYAVFSGKWPEKEHNITGYQVQAYFTPYRKTFKSFLYDQGGKTYYYFNADDGLPESIKYDNGMNIVLSLLSQAQSEILVYSFAFNDRVVMDEIIKATKQRGVKAKVYMDYNMYRSVNQYYSESFRNLATEIGEFYICRQSNGGLLHHKVILIDGKVVVLGSLNFSNSAVTGNDENFLVIKNAPQLVDAFKTEADRIAAESFRTSDLELFSGSFDPNDEEVTPFAF